MPAWFIPTSSRHGVKSIKPEYSLQTRVLATNPGTCYKPGYSLQTRVLATDPGTLYKPGYSLQTRVLATDPGTLYKPGYSLQTRVLSTDPGTLYRPGYSLQTRVLSLYKPGYSLQNSCRMPSMKAHALWWEFVVIFIFATLTYTDIIICSFLVGSIHLCRFYRDL